MPKLKEQGVDFARRIECSETRPPLMLSMLGVMFAMRRGGCAAVRAQLVAQVGKARRLR